MSVSNALAKGNCGWCGELTHNRRDIKPPFRMYVWACNKHYHLLSAEADRKLKAYESKKTRETNNSKNRVKEYQRGRS